eukprot:5105884-Lingulodinium_polyedra.AAC.1
MARAMYFSPSPAPERTIARVLCPALPRGGRSCAWAAPGLAVRAAATPSAPVFTGVWPRRCRSDFRAAKHP